MAEGPPRGNAVIDVLIAYASAKGTTKRVSEAIVGGLESTGATAAAIQPKKLPK